MKHGDLPETSVDAYRAVAMEFNALYTHFAKDCGLSASEYWSLLLLYQGNVSTQCEICKRLPLNRQTISVAFKLLRKKGLVELEPLPNDQRQKQAILTRSGQQFADTCISHLSEVERQAWLKLPLEERASLTRLTRKYAGLLRQALQDHDTAESSQGRSSL